MSNRKELTDKLKAKGLFDLPVGYHTESKAIVALGDVIDQLSKICPISELDRSQREALVLQRWKAGGWSDIYAGDELITLDRAIKEVQANTELGQDLVNIHIGAIEMMLEDLT